MKPTPKLHFPTLEPTGWTPLEDSAIRNYLMLTNLETPNPAMISKETYETVALVEMELRRPVA